MIGESCLDEAQVHFMLAVIEACQGSFGNKEEGAFDSLVRKGLRGRGGTLR